MNETALAPTQSPEGYDQAWQIWGLIKQELLFLCWALMEVAILTPIALTIMRWSRYWPEGLVFLWLLLLILLPFNLVRLLGALGVERKDQWRYLVATLVVALLISWRGLLYAPRPILDLSWLSEFFGRVGDLTNPLWARDLTVFVFIVIAWWRGLRLAHMTPDIYRIGFRLRAGGLVLLPIAFFLHATGRLWGVTPYILLYFLAGLTVVALIRAEQIERERSGFAASLTPRWVLTVFLTSLLIVTIAGLIGMLISGEAMNVLGGHLAPLWAAFVALFAVSLSTVVYLLTPALNLLTFILAFLIEVVSGIFSRFGVIFSPETMPSLEDLQPFSNIVRPEDPLTIKIPANLSRMFTIVIMLTLAAIITFALTRYFRQPQTAVRSGTDPNIVRTIIEPAQGISERIMQRLGLMRRWRTAASIQRVYRDMGRHAAAFGYPRAVTETPYEYLVTLYKIWPDNRSNTSLITEAYIRVRYGEIPETEQELQAILAAWKTLSAVDPTIETTAFTLTDQSKE